MLVNLFLITSCLSHPLAVFHQWNFNLPESCGWARSHCATFLSSSWSHCQCETGEVRVQLWHHSAPPLSAHQTFSEGQIQSMVGFWNFQLPLPDLGSLFLYKSQLQWKRESQSQVIFVSHQSITPWTCCTYTGAGVKGTISSWMCKPAPGGRKAALTGCIPITSSDSHCLALSFVKARVKQANSYLLKTEECD